MSSFIAGCPYDPVARDTSKQGGLRRNQLERCMDEIKGC